MLSDSNKMCVTQRAADAGDTVEEGLTGPLDVEGHPVSQTAHEADVGILHVEDHHVSAHGTVLGVALQHLAQLHRGQGVQLGVRVAHLEMKARNRFRSHRCALITQHE